MPDMRLFGKEVSCSAIQDSDWARGFGLIGPLIGHGSVLNQPNYHYGILFYAISLVSVWCNWRTMNRIMALSGGGAMVFFSYAMLDIGKLCIVCILGNKFIFDLIDKLVNTLHFTTQISTDAAEIVRLCGGVI